MTLPKRIDPSPIKEAIIEIRFESALPPDAVFGVIYNDLKDLYKEVEQLPILQIPEFVRVHDSNLAFQPHYRLKKGNYILQIGPKVISLAIVNEYLGWEEYLKEILTVFERIKKIDFITKVSRFGLRYINIFEIDILDQTNLKIMVSDREIHNKETFIKTSFQEKGFQTVLQVGNNLVLQVSDAVPIIGSIIDVDVSKEIGSSDFFNDIDSLLNEAHVVEKEQFFGLLKQEYLASLNPSY